jgi:RAB protein geranylgeranyltransferase component A
MDIIVDSVSKNDHVPHEAMQIASTPLMPLFLAKWGMRFFGSRMWKSQVKDKSVIKKMYDRPYEI